jgi:hypothetical protein
MEPTLFERFLLFFCRMQTYVDFYENMAVDYKVLGDRMFIYDIRSLPPRHVNCRCWLLEVNDVKADE